MAERNSLAVTVGSRLEQTLHDMIAGGQWQGGERLPSVRELTRRFGVSRNTVQAAVRGLAEAGLVRSVPRHGTIVLPQKNTGGQQPAVRKAMQIGVIDLLTSQRYEDQQTESWYQSVIRGAEHVLATSSYHLTKITFLRDEAFWVRKACQRLEKMSDELAGVILYSDIATDKLLSGLDKLGIPWVTVGRRSLREVHNFVAVDHLSAGQLVGWTFAQLNYNKILYLGRATGEHERLTGLAPKPDEKFLGLVQGFTDGGGDTTGISHRFCEKPTVDNAYETTCKFIDTCGVPSGVFANTDWLSLGAMRALIDRGIKVPQEAGVVGSMGIATAQFATPPLTVLSQPVQEMGQQVTQLLLEMIRGDVNRVSGRFVSCELQLRESLSLSETLQKQVEKRQAASLTLNMKTGL